MRRGSLTLGCVALLAAAGCGGDDSRTDFSSDRSSVRSVALCAGKTSDQENVVDEFDTAVDTDAVGNLAREVFGPDYSGQAVDRVSCPATLRVFAADIHDRESDEFNSGLTQLERVDQERVHLEEIQISLTRLRAEQDIATRILSSESAEFSSVESEVELGHLVIGSPRPLPGNLRNRLEKAIEIPVTFREEGFATTPSG